MKSMRIIPTILLTTVLLATQIIAVGAAPARQETPPITGTVESVVLETDGTGTTTVLVMLIDESGEAQTVRLSLEDGTSLGLVIEGQPVNPEDLEDPVEIDPALVIPDAPEETEDEAQHPVGSALSDFFSDLLGVEYERIMEYHDEGVGFGVIAQALWMTNALEGDSDIFAAILDAKQNHDFSDITLPDGSTPNNWGQFRKAVMHDRKKSKENLGAIMSGRANNDQDEEVQDHARNNGNGNTPDQGKGNHKDKNKEKGNNGNGNNKDKNKGKGNN